MIRQLIVVGGLAACGTVIADEESATNRALSKQEQLQVVMHKNPGCGCCDIWADHLREHGFSVDVTEDAQIFSRKERLKIPQPLYSCHTALVDGYFVEGHVPAADILSLLKLKPEHVTGLAVPGMPLGSPGMEHPRPQDFNTIALLSDGSAYVFAQHKAGDDFAPNPEQSIKREPDASPQ
jgi:hypothetical protein